MEASGARQGLYRCRVLEETSIEKVVRVADGLPDCLSL